MKITRLYADEDGESHFADLDLELADAGQIGRLSDPIPAASVIFRTNEPGYDYDWHVAPQRQFIVLLDGAIEIETSDGRRRTFRGGDVLLMEDTSGRGHRTRNIEPRERRSIFIVLADHAGGMGGWGPDTREQSMDPVISGVHHVTAITADAQKNVDFYCGVLGLRLVKRTVNFDDPRSYHLYFGDELGRPGTILTFFAWPGVPRGRIGPPQVSATAFAAPAGALDYWQARLREYKVETIGPVERMGEPVLQFADPDGMAIEIIAATQSGGTRLGGRGGWADGPVPVEHAIRGFHGVTISEEGYERTAETLTSLMGFSLEGDEGNRFRYRAGGAGDGFAATVDLLCVPDARHGLMGAGIVHHVAFRTPDDEQQHLWRDLIAKAALNVSPVMDRKYFYSIYFREPGGVLFEIATDAPGFAVDEPPAQLGAGLMLPALFEPRRAEIEAGLPKLSLPHHS